MIAISLAREQSTVTAGAGSSLAALTPEGRFAVLNSASANLLVGQEDTNGATDAFLVDRLLGTIRLLTHRPGEPLRTDLRGGSAHAISPDGRRVLVSRWDGSVLGYALLDTLTDSFSPLPPGLQPAATSAARTWSADGRFLVLVRLDRDPWTYSLVLVDTSTGSTQLVTHRAGDPAAPAGGVHRAVALTPDGRYLLYTSDASDLATGQLDAAATDDTFLFDRTTGRSELISAAPGQPVVALGGAAQGVSNNGRWVVLVGPPTLGGFAGDAAQVFLFDRTLRQMRLISRAAGTPIQPANGSAESATVSPNGRFVLFGSAGTDLVAGQLDTIAATDLFLHDRDAGTTELVSRAAGAPERSANAGSAALAISGDGRFATFRSAATDLVTGIMDANGASDLFRFDRTLRSSTLLSHPVDDPFRTGRIGAGEGLVSLDGRVVAFETWADDLAAGLDLNRQLDTFAWSNGAAELLGPPAFPVRTTSARGATGVRLTPNGRHVAFAASGHDLLPGEDATDSSSHSYLFDRTSSQLESLGSGGVADLTPDAEVVLLTSLLTLPGAPPGTFSNAVVFDRSSGQTTIASHAAGAPGTSADGPSVALALSTDGRFVLFASSATNLVVGQVDPAETSDLFLYDRQTATATLVTHAAGNAARTANAATDGSYRIELTPDGRFVLFSSTATDLVAGSDPPHTQHAFLFDRTTGQVELVSHQPGAPTSPLADSSSAAAVSDDGRWVAFETLPFPSAAIQVVLLDRTTGNFHRVTRDFDGGDRPASRSSSLRALSPDGRYLLLDSEAPLLAGADLPRAGQVYLYDRVLDRFELISHRHGSPLKGSNSWAFGLDLSPDGRFVLFEGFGNDLTASPSDLPGADDYLYDRVTREAKLVSHRPGEPHGDSNALDPLFFSGRAAVSDDGTTVAFVSQANNLYPHDFNYRVTFPGEDGRLPDVFLHVEEVEAAKPRP